MTELEKTQIRFARDVVGRAQRNLGSYRYVQDRRGRKKKRRAESTGTLRKSLGYVRDVNSGGTRFTFIAKGEAANYASFVEQGVNGTEKNWGSPFRFRGKNINQKAVMDWMRKKPIRLREYKDGKLGGFTKATESKRKQAAFLIGRSIAKYGFAPLNYMQDAVLAGLEDWEQEFLTAMEKDLDNRF